MSEVEYYEETLMNVAKKLVALSDEIVSAISANQSLRSKMRLRRALDELFPSTIGLRKDE